MINKHTSIEFIPFQQALALKELGFDEPCSLMQQQIIYRNGNLCEANEDAIELFISFEDEIVIAPTFSQVLRWFREKYELHSWVTMELGSTLSFCWVITGEHKGTEHEAFFATYEEAELACLIKLIQILNQKL